MLTLNIVNKPKIEQDWSIERIAKESPSISWEKVFEDALPELHDISDILLEQEKLYGSFYPLKRDIFAAFDATTLSNVKVVIIGQDPYHQSVTIRNEVLPRAVGLSFSVRRDDSIPSSLQNIYTELANTLRGFNKPDHGDLREWARQGVLLLNMSLTVRPGAPGSHGDIWLGFINKVFKAIASVNPYCIYMLWGKEAQKVKPMLGERSVILEAAHPSGLSARKGFFGCNHFNLSNDWLIRQGKIAINWRISSLYELIGPGIPQIVETNKINHNPVLKPVNLNELPIIPELKQSHPPPKPKPQSPKQLLPTIPNIGSIDKDGNIHKPTPRSPKQSSPSPEPVPIIPKINFGANFNTSSIITLSHPQPLPKILDRQLDPEPKPTIIGLPIIPALF